jgi:hypothetical protein
MAHGIWPERVKGSIGTLWIQKGYSVTHACETLPYVRAKGTDVRSSSPDTDVKTRTAVAPTHSHFQRVSGAQW